VPKCEIFDRSDFYTIKPFWGRGDFVVKIIFFIFRVSFRAVKFLMLKLFFVEFGQKNWLRLFVSVSTDLLIFCYFTYFKNYQKY
jgi:hypothetical protein